MTRLIHNFRLPETTRIIAFTGGQSVHPLIRKFAQELSAKGETVLTTGLGQTRLPYNGETIVANRMPHLLDQLNKAFQSRRVVACGSSIDGQQLGGFNAGEMQQLVEAAAAKWLLVDLGRVAASGLGSSRPVASALRKPFWHSLIISIDDLMANQQEQFVQEYGSPVSPWQSFIAANPEISVHLFFNNILQTNDENQLIALSRELHRSGLNHFTFGDIESEIFKPMLVA